MNAPLTIWTNYPSSTSFSKLLVQCLQSFFGDADRQTELDPSLRALRLWSADDSLTGVYISAGQDADFINSSRQTAVFVSADAQDDISESIPPRLLSITVEGALLNPATLSLMSGSVVLAIKAITKTECEQLRDELAWYLRKNRETLAEEWLLEALVVKSISAAAMPERAAYYVSSVGLTWARRYNAH